MAPALATARLVHVQGQKHLCRTGLCNGIWLSAGWTQGRGRGVKRGRGRWARGRGRVQGPAGRGAAGLPPGDAPAGAGLVGGPRGSLDELAREALLEAQGAQAGARGPLCGACAEGVTQQRA